MPELDTKLEKEAGKELKDKPEIDQSSVSIPKEELDKLRKDAQDKEALEAELLFRSSGFEEEHPAQKTPPPGSAQPQSQTGDSIPEGYKDFKDWHKDDPESATAWKASQIAKQQSTLNQIETQRKEFETSVISKNPQLADPKKRILDPVYREFLSIIKEAPELAIRKVGLEAAWERAERKAGVDQEAIREAKSKGMKEEQNRMRAAQFSSQASGGGSSYQSGSETGEELSQEERFVATRGGMSEKEYKEWGKGRSIILNHGNERAKR